MLMEIKLSAALSRNLEGWEMIVVQMYHCGVIIRLKKSIWAGNVEKQPFPCRSVGVPSDTEAVSNADQQFGIVFVKQFDVQGVVGDAWCLDDMTLES